MSVAFFDDFVEIKPKSARGLEKLQCTLKSSPAQARWSDGKEDKEAEMEMLQLRDTGVYMVGKLYREVCMFHQHLCGWKVAEASVKLQVAEIPETGPLSWSLISK